MNSRARRRQRRAARDARLPHTPVEPIDVLVRRAVAAVSTDAFRCIYLPRLDIEDENDCAIGRLLWQWCHYGEWDPTPLEVRVVYTSKNAGQLKAERETQDVIILRGVRRELETNTLLRSDYGDACEGPFEFRQATRHGGYSLSAPGRELQTGLNLRIDFD